eukprot:2660010-Heterocapsa_arctica.AAC.1
MAGGTMLHILMLHRERGAPTSEYVAWKLFEVAARDLSSIGPSKRSYMSAKHHNGSGIHRTPRHHW